MKYAILLALFAVISISVLRESKAQRVILNQYGQPIVFINQVGGSTVISNAQGQPIITTAPLGSGSVSSNEYGQPFAYTTGSNPSLPVPLPGVIPMPQIVRY